VQIIASFDVVFDAKSTEEKVVKPTDTLDFVRCLHASSVTAIPLGQKSPLGSVLPTR
jgi:hypothetical protein